MKMLAEYLEKSHEFERMAAGEQISSLMAHGSVLGWESMRQLRLRSVATKPPHRDGAGAMAILKWGV